MHWKKVSECTICYITAKNKNMPRRNSDSGSDFSTVWPQSKPSYTWVKFFADIYSLMGVNHTFAEYVNEADIDLDGQLNADEFRNCRLSFYVRKISCVTNNQKRISSYYVSALWHQWGRLHNKRRVQTSDTSCWRLHFRQCKSSCFKDILIFLCKFSFSSGHQHLLCWASRCQWKNLFQLFLANHKWE